MVNVNYSRDHRSIRAFYNRINNREVKEHADYGGIFTPNMRHDPKEEKDYVEWMKKKQVKVDKHYESHVKDILNPDKDVKYFKRDYEKAWKTSSISTVSKRKQVVGRYKYKWNKK